ncbi:MAG: hypothetical protein REI11_09280, partial [Patulibacter sp.]|nr:hypothetical protein [Patulibacter sp.]
MHATRGGGASPCSGCGASLAADQRYCVECGRRTNEARPTLMREPGQQGVHDLGAAEASAPAALRTGNSPQGTLIVGVGVLLLAVGVGVLIGHNGNDSSSKAAAQQPIYIPQTASAVAGSTPGTALAATTPDASAATTDASSGGSDTAVKK